MWFKNLRIYRLTAELEHPVAAWEERLAESAFVPCSGSDAVRMGWVPPLGPAGTQYVHAYADFHLVCARTQERLMPSSAVKEALDEKIQAVETAERRTLRKREKMDLKDEIIQTLLPRALTRSHLSYALLLTQPGLLLIDSATPGRAEELLNLLRDSLDRLSVKPLVPKHNPAELLTRWLAGGRLPKAFSLGQHCDLRDPLHAANVVRCRQQELLGQELRSHIDAGKQVIAMGLGWKNRLNFVLQEDLGLRSLKFTDVTQNDAGIDDNEDMAARFDADFVLMAQELDALCKDLIEVFGSAA